MMQSNTRRLALVDALRLKLDSFFQPALWMELIHL